MRIWDIQARDLCRKHLLAEHQELHGLWNILTKHGKKGGYSNHPETKRWIGKEMALFLRHEELVKEFQKRGYRHMTPLDKELAKGTENKQDVLLDSIQRQKELLSEKPCDCNF